MIKTATSEFLNDPITKLPKGREARYARGSAIFMVGLLSIIFTVGFNASFAQSTEMRVFALAPEWNGSQVCDNGNGYDPTPINAPSMSYSGKDIKDAEYTYSWEQRINDQDWKVVASGSGKSFISAYNPPPIHHSNKTSTPDKYAWRLKVKDVANGNQSAVTDVYTLTVAAKVNATYTTSNSKNKFDIQLTANGGYPGKQFTWRADGGVSSLPASEKNAEDPKGVSAGNYIVVIDDKVCASVKQPILVNGTPADTSH